MVEIKAEELIGYLAKISRLHDKVDELEEAIKDKEKDSMSWFQRWRTLKDKYEPEEQKEESDE
jgi:hypothetical protein